MSRILYFSILLILPVCTTHAQIHFEGKVKDSHRRPVEFANVFVMGTLSGSSTDSTGCFSFSATHSDTLMLTVRSVGFEVYEKVYTNLPADTVINTKITLRQTAYRLEGVVISSFTDIVSDKGRTSAVRTDEIKQIPGSYDDISMGLRSLPGNQHIGDEEGLFIRGGDKTETKIYVDGLEIPVYYRSGQQNMLQRSWLSPKLFEGTYFSSGGYSALYGDALSGALVLESTRFPDKNDYNVSFSSLGGYADMTHVTENKKWMISPSVEYMNLQPYYSLVEQEFNYINHPRYLNFYLNGRYKPNDTDIVKMFVATEKSDLSLTDVNLDYEGYDQYFSTDNAFLFGFLVYEKWFNERTKFYIGSSYSFFETDEKYMIVRQEDFDDRLYEQPVNTSKQFSETRVDLTRFIGDKVILRTGANWHYNDYEKQPAEIQEVINYNQLSSFAEVEWTINPNFVSKGGLRIDYNEITDKLHLSPRFSAGWLPSDKNQLLFSYGNYNQTPEWNYLTGGLEALPHSSHYILTFLHRNSSILFRMEGYYKDYGSLVTVDNGIVGTDGKGYARGIDVFFRQNNSRLANLEYWMSYSYLDTERKHLNYPIMTRPQFAAEHTLSVVARRFVPAVSCYFAATYAFATGRPYFNPNLDDSRFLSEKSRDHHGLDLVVAHILQIGGRYNLTAAFTVSNPFGWKHEFGYRYSSDGQTRRAIIPSASRFYYLGFYFNWGRESGKQVIDELTR